MVLLQRLEQLMIKVQQGKRWLFSINMPKR